MDNLEKLTTLGTQDTGQIQTNITQHRKLSIRATRTQPKTGVNPGVREG
jgi:hypothetical protein